MAVCLCSDCGSTKPIKVTSRTESTEAIMTTVSTIKFETTTTKTPTTTKIPTTIQTPTIIQTPTTQTSITSQTLTTIQTQTNTKITASKTLTTATEVPITTSTEKIIHNEKLIIDCNNYYESNWTGQNNTINIRGTSISPFSSSFLLFNLINDDNDPDCYCSVVEYDHNTNHNCDCSLMKQSSLHFRSDSLQLPFPPYSDLHSRIIKLSPYQLFMAHNYKHNLPSFYLDRILEKTSTTEVQQFTLTNEEISSKSTTDNHNLTTKLTNDESSKFSHPDEESSKKTTKTTITTPSPENNKVRFNTFINVVRVQGNPPEFLVLSRIMSIVCNFTTMDNFTIIDAQLSLGLALEKGNCYDILDNTTNHDQKNIWFASNFRALHQQMGFVQCTSTLSKYNIFLYQVHGKTNDGQYNTTEPNGDERKSINFNRRRKRSFSDEDTLTTGLWRYPKTTRSSFAKDDQNVVVLEHSKKNANEDWQVYSQESLKDPDTRNSAKPAGKVSLKFCE